MTKLKPYISISPVILWFLVIAAVGLSELWVISIEANPNIIAGYHFGAEAMISHGGEKYRSAAIYANSSLTLGLCSLAGIVFVLITQIKAKKYKILKAYCAGISFSVLLYLGFGI
jgi:hypothetical protein